VELRGYEVTTKPASAGILPTKRMLIFVSASLSLRQKYKDFRNNLIEFAEIYSFLTIHSPE